MLVVDDMFIWWNAVLLPAALYFYYSRIRATVLYVTIKLGSFIDMTYAVSVLVGGLEGYQPSKNFPF
jgi:hypothetical protein